MKERLVVLARRSCDKSEHGLPAIAPVAPSSKRYLDESQWGDLWRGPIQKRQPSRYTRSPSVMHYKILSVF